MVADLLDNRCDGRCPFGGDDVQPHRRPGHRREEPAYGESRIADRKIVPRIRMGFSLRIDRNLSPGIVLAELLTFALSPVALVCILGYSYAKRYTAFSHLLLGLALSIAPTAAWIAVRGEINSEIPILLSMFVLMWTAGFDVLYACQDYSFDKKAGLRSIPARFGIKNALWIARLFHAQAFVVLVLLYFVTGLGWIALAGVLAVGVLMIYQHTLVKADDLSRMNAAFFTTNAFVSVILLVTFGGAVFANGLQ
jgi:4-hydroxybenzoate polyprenyltransferase